MHNMTTHTLSTRSTFVRTLNKSKYGKGVFQSAIERLEHSIKEMDADEDKRVKMQDRFKNRIKVD